MTAGPPIQIPVPVQLRGKLTKIAAEQHRTLEDWIKDLLIRAAEEREPRLARSMMWRDDVAAWRVAEEDDR
jgi:hypothetical protein